MLPSSYDLFVAMMHELRLSDIPKNAKEIDLAVAKALNISQSDLEELHSGNRTKFAYRMAWERTHAKNKGLITPLPGRKWQVTDEGRRF